MTSPSEPEIGVDIPDENRQAMVKSHSLLAGKGWSSEGKLLVFHEFLMEKKLYAEFNEFVRKRR